MIRKLLSAKRGLGLLALVTAVVSVFGIALAQTLPAGDPVQIFQSLTPEQQQAILERATGASPGAGSSSATGSGTRRATPATQAAEAERRRRATEPAEPLVPVLRADDTVVVELSLPPESTNTPQVPIAPVTP